MKKKPPLWTYYLDPRISSHGYVWEARGRWGVYTIIPPTKAGGFYKLVFFNQHGHPLPSEHRSDNLLEIGESRDHEQLQKLARRHATWIRQPMPRG